MAFIPAVLLSIIFLVLGLIHFSWVLGWDWGMDVSLPTNIEGSRVFNPKKIDTAIVGAGLIAFSVFYILFAQVIDYSLPAWLFKYGRWIIPVIFLLRACGDVKYVGLFKKIKNTPFAKMDDRFFTPLCLIISLLGFVVIWLNS